eukprot:3135556-Prymnesium_polylepis.1
MPSSFLAAASMRASDTQHLLCPAEELGLVASLDTVLAIDDIAFHLVPRLSCCFWRVFYVDAVRQHMGWKLFSRPFQSVALICKSMHAAVAAYLTHMLHQPNVDDAVSVLQEFATFIFIRNREPELAADLRRNLFR